MQAKQALKAQQDAASALAAMNAKIEAGGIMLGGAGTVGRGIDSAVSGMWQGLWGDRWQGAADNSSAERERTQQGLVFFTRRE